MHYEVDYCRAQNLGTSGRTERVVANTQLIGLRKISSRGSQVRWWYRK